MNKRNFRLHDGEKGSALAIRVIPNSRKERIAEVMKDGTLKIWLKNASDDPDLNRSLKDFLSGVLQIPPGGIDVVAGENGLDKLVSVLNLDAEAVQQRITSQLR